MKTSIAGILLLSIVNIAAACDKCNDTGIIEVYDTDSKTFATKAAAILREEQLNESEFQQQEAQLQAQLNSGGSGSVIGKKPVWVAYVRTDGNFGVRRMTPNSST